MQKLDQDLPALNRLQCCDRIIGWREAGQGRTVLLLHGISSGSASWIRQFNDPELTERYRLIAWDAPGYRQSTPLPVKEPSARDYVDSVAEIIRQQSKEPVVLVGHSLGAMIAAAVAARYPDKVAGLFLANPAQGYGSDTSDRQRTVYHQRLIAMKEIGPVAYAQQRASVLLRPGADSHALAVVREGMENLNESGFLAAAWMLANDDIHTYLPECPQPIRLLSGARDTITPPEGVKVLARQYDCEVVTLSDAGHASYLDSPGEFDRALMHFLISLNCE